LLNGIAQRAHDVILPQHIIERAGPVFAGEDLVAHAATLRAPPRFVMAFAAFCGLSPSLSLIPPNMTDALGHAPLRFQYFSRKIIIAG
jgi:hypothetical protein